MWRKPDDARDAYQCPACGRNDQIRVQASVWMWIEKDGTEPDLDDGDIEFDDASQARCGACDHSGQFAEFKRYE